MAEPKKKQAVSVKPPFFRPDLSERQITVRISDNGIQANLNRSKVKQPSILSVYEYNVKPSRRLKITSVIGRLLEITHHWRNMKGVKSSALNLESKLGIIVPRAMDPLKVLLIHSNRRGTKG